MKSSLRQFPVKQKSYVSLFIGIMVFAVSVAVGLRVDATPMPTQTLSGSITSSRTLDAGYVYIVDSGVTIETGVTLTIPAGTIVKYDTYGLITVWQGGSLRVTGSAASPVHFTSLKDDTVGGDTNGDGNTTAPAIDDFQQAIVTENGDTNIVFAEFRYVGRAIEGTRTTGSVVITDSTFDNGHVAVKVSAPTIKLYRNKFNNLSPYSIDGAVQVSGVLDLTKISLSGIDQNVFTGTAKFSRIIRISWSLLPAGKTWSMSNSSGAIPNFKYSAVLDGTTVIGENMQIVLSTSLRVNGTMTIQAGVIVKHQYEGYVLVPDGKLYVTANASNPVHFTSIKDDAIGGDTNGDGSATVPVKGDYAWAIKGQNGEVNVVFAKFKYSIETIEVRRDTGSIVITDSTFDNVENAIYAEAPTVKLYRNNILHVTPQYIDGAVRVKGAQDLTRISLNGPDQNIFTGTAKFARNIKVESGIVPIDKTWNVATTSNATVVFTGYSEIKGTALLKTGTKSVILGQLLIDGTLNIQSDWLKFGSGFVSARQGGAVNVTGAINNKVVLTDVRDDTIGGDTNGDENATLPQNDILAFIFSSQGSHINSKYVHFKQFANQSIGSGSYSNSYCSAGSISVEDSVFNAPFSTTGCGSTEYLSLKRNIFSVVGNAPLQISNVEMSGIKLAGPDKNIFQGEGRSRAVVIRNYVSVDVGNEAEIDPQTGAVLLIENPLQIRGKLILKAGTIVKNSGQASIVTHTNTANLTVEGTSTQRVVFTSAKDDSIAGDSNGDGLSIATPLEYGTAVQAGLNSQVSIKYADFKYGYYAVAGYAASSFCAESGDISVSDSFIAAPINLASCGYQGKLSLKRNIFTTTTPAVNVRNMDISNIMLSGSDKNIFNGTPYARTLVLGDSTSIASDKAWTIDDSANATLIIEGSLYVYGSMSLNPGTKIKGRAPILAPGSVVSANGNQYGDIVLTSLRDDTIGGDTNNDGAGTVPGSSDNIGFNVPAGVSVNFSGIDIRYSAQAINVMGGEATLTKSRITNSWSGIGVSYGKAIYRGSITNISDKAAWACTWTTDNCMIDAAYTDWGSTGPTASLVCGQVTTSPWYAGGSTATDGLFRSKNCDGSPTPSEKLTTSTSNFSSRMSIRGIDCSNGFQDACQAIVTAQNCLGAATTLAASTSSFPLPNGNAYQQPAQWGSMLADNASTYIQSIEGPVPALSAASFGMNLLSAVSTVMNVANAYDTCAP